MSILSDEERRALIGILENLVTNEQELHKMLTDAWLHVFLAEAHFTDAYYTAKDLITALERYGGPLDKPFERCWPLGALLCSLLRLDVRPLLPSEKHFFACLIVRHSLIDDASYVTELRSQYHLPEVLMACPLPDKRIPFSPQARSYAVLDIQLFVCQEPEYLVQLRFSRPGDTTMYPPVSGKATFDVLEILKATDPHEYGTYLTGRLFHDEAVKQEFRNISLSTEASNLPLRLRLFIDAGAHKLHALRWETLLNPLKMESPLLTSEHILFSRFLAAHDFRQKPLAFNQPHHVLVVIANPTNIGNYGPDRQQHFDEIPVQEERERVAGYLSTVPYKELVSNPSSPGLVTLSNLITRLREGYTVLYLICHGATHTKSGFAPYICLEQPDSTTEMVKVKELTTQIEQMSQRPQLVVLGSCQSVGNSRYGPDGSTVLTTLGPELISAGVPSVIGMQGNISMSTLAEFIPTFFREWQNHGQLDRAIAVARKRVIQQDDWWMPVLFTRLIDGHL